MKKTRTGIFLTLLLALGIAGAIPITTFTWNEERTYIDGTIMPPTEVLTYTIYCGITSSGPYPFSYVMGDDINSGTADIATCVQGVPGTYFFVITALSNTYNSESAFSEETSRVYTADDLGRVPLAPTLFSVQ